jgi:serine/threonine protein kinase
MHRTTRLHLYLQLTSAVIHLHENLHFCHRDLKPSNILIRTAENVVSGEEEGEVARHHLLLSDFGYACKCNDSDIQLMEGAVGSPGFYAPEMFLSKKGYDPRGADIWSLGVVFLEMMLDEELFEELWMQQGPFQPSDVIDVDQFRMKMLRALRSLRDAGRSGGDGSGSALYTEDVGRIFRQTLVMNPKYRCVLLDLQRMIQEFILSD